MKERWKEMIEKLWSVSEVAERLGVPKSWVYERTRLRRIPCHKLGKYVRFDPEEIQRWIKDQQLKDSEGRLA